MTYKITVFCEPKQPGLGGGRGVAGTFLSKAWWGVFEYWLSVKLRGEGLLITSLEVDEIVEHDTQVKR